MFELRGPPPRAGHPLVVVAVLEEAVAFAHRLPTLVTGVGKVRAATATTWAGMAHRPSLILNLGTAGALRPAEMAGGVVHEIGAVLQHDVNGRAIARLVGSDPSPRIELGDSGVVLATGDRFISSPQDRDALAERAHLVDMEGYAVAASAARLGIPVRLAKTVSDDAGHGAAVTWIESLHSASRRLATWLDEAL